MVIGSQGLKLFPFIKPDHRFYPEVTRFETVLNETGFAELWMERNRRGERTAVHSEIKGVYSPNQGWRLERFYSSLQTWNRLEPFGFRSKTLYYSLKADRLSFHDFPDDPYLPAMNSFFRENDDRGEKPSFRKIEVLRYVPLRRLTFRLSDGGGDLVGKFKKRSRLSTAYEKLTSVFQSAQAFPESFAVAGPKGIDERRGLFFQEAMPGHDLSQSIDRSEACPLLHAVGRFHADLLGLEVPGLPEWDFSLFLQERKREIASICFFRPEWTLFFDRLWKRLIKEVPPIVPSEQTFCHGDFVCSQILKGEDRWSIIDFDLCMRGDPHREVAMLIASLKYDVPFFEREVIDSKGGRPVVLEAAGEAYLEGYLEKSKYRVNRRRLLWHRICAEIYYLALMLKKDRFHPALFDAGIILLHDLSEELPHTRGGSF